MELDLRLYLSQTLSLLDNIVGYTSNTIIYTDVIVMKPY